jgi:hypothetical protein
MKPTSSTRKPIDQLTPEDLRVFPIWEFAIDAEGLEGRDETWVRPLGATAVPPGAYSLSVAATFHTPRGQKLHGIVGVTTNAEPELGDGALVLDDAYIFIPSATFGGAPQEYADVAERLGLPLSELFPLRFVLAVPIEGEPAPRTGEFGP